MRHFTGSLARIACASVLMGASLVCAAAEDSPGAPGPGQVRIQNVEVLATFAGPVVLLKVYDRAVPIFVDAIVAESIQGALTRKKGPRPLTHDLMHSVLSAFDGKVSQVVVTLKDRTFYAALTVSVGSSVKVFDSRSSDAIALAIHFKAPILIPQELLDTSGVDVKPEGTPL
jgi:bifunctional DNase/RNase